MARLRSIRISVTLAIIGLSAVAGVSPSASAQTILYVKADAAGANNGSSWANAFTHPQAALAAAAPIAGGGTPVQIWVAAGTYLPDGGRILVDGIRIAGSGDRNATGISLPPLILNHSQAIGRSYSISLRSSVRSGQDGAIRL